MKSFMTVDDNCEVYSSKYTDKKYAPLKSKDVLPTIAPNQA